MFRSWLCRPLDIEDWRGAVSMVPGAASALGGSYVRGAVVVIIPKENDGVGFHPGGKVDDLLKNALDVGAGILLSKGPEAHVVPIDSGVGASTGVIVGDGREGCGCGVPLSAESAFDISDIVGISGNYLKVGVGDSGTVRDIDIKEAGCAAGFEDSSAPIAD